MPFGLTRSVNSPDPLQIMQNAKYVGFLWEQNTWFHIAQVSTMNIRRTSRPGGSAIRSRKWDGDTLVIDTIGFNGRTRLDTIGHPHSAQMHVIERYTRTDLGHIAYEMTIDDPVTYTKPWKNVRTFTLRPDWEIMEYSCEENNKDFRRAYQGYGRSEQARSVQINTTAAGPPSVHPGTIKTGAVCRGPSALLLTAARVQAQGQSGEFEGRPVVRVAWDPPAQPVDPTTSPKFSR